MPNNERITPVAPDVRPMPETATIDGQPAWLARHVGVALGYQEPERVRWTAEAGREGFDPAAHIVYADGEAYLTAEGVRHACSRRKRSKGLAARLLEHIETETAPKREWSTREPYVPSRITPPQPWPRRPTGYDPRPPPTSIPGPGRLAGPTPPDRVPSMILGVGGVLMLAVGVAFAPESILADALTSIFAAAFLFASGLKWGSR